jgi:hypothetical protein
MNIGSRLFAELVGTFWLVFGGCGSAILAAAFPDVGIGLLGVSLAFGLTVMTMAYAIGHISGCHLNPAVTIGLVVAKRHAAKDLVPYILAQVVGAVAGAAISHGKGRVIAAGFCPMLAYGQLANFKPSTLEEKWPAEPRELIRHALLLAQVKQAVRCDVPVVEASLLSGPRGTALVLVNYTYQPITSLTVDVRLADVPASATSTEGKAVRVEKTAEGIRLRLPLEWTDVVILK